MGGTRVIAYAYDGLLRLTAAVGSPGTAFSYSYDLAGNRIAATQNGTLVEQHAYDAANQVIGLAYDNAGNLINDATTTYTYDALNRLTQQGSTSNAYNGDGVLVRQVVGGTTTDYTQDLAAPLSQVLQTRQGSTTTQHLYGLDRLASVTGATRTWYGTDTLGSVRLTLGDTGAVLGGANYDPWGTVEGSPVAPFGFTGEIQDSGGMVYLRARWYNPTQGRFGARDMFQGDPERPYSQHPYQYGYSDPVLMTDPSGQCIPIFDITCQGELNLPTLATLCVSSWVPLIGQQDCKPIGNVDDFREALVDPIVGMVKPTYDVITDQPDAREAVRRGLEYSYYHPLDPIIIFGLGLVSPFVNIYQGLSCRDSTQLAHGLIGFEFLLGAARLTRMTRAVPKLSDGETLLATNPKASPPLGHNVVGVRLPGAPKPTFFEQVMGEAGRGVVKDFLTAIRGGEVTRIIQNSGKKLGNFNVDRIALSEEQARAAYVAAQRMRGPSGPYNILNNSCTTTCIAVLKAAGLKPPWWARTPRLLDLWFRSQGIKNVPIPGIYGKGRE